MPMLFQLSLKKSLVLSCLWIVGVFFFLGDRYPTPWPDESLYADIIRHLIESGSLGIPLFKGYFEQIESHQHFYPPLYFLTGGAIFQIFPLGLLTLRFFSYVCLIGSAILLIATVIRPWGIRFVFPALFLLIFDPLFLRGALVARMDAFAILLMVSSLVLLHRAEENQPSRSPIFLFGLSGFFSGLAFVTHPMAWSALCALGLYLCFRLASRKLRLKELLTFSFSAFVPIAPYLFWIYSDGLFFVEQFVAQVERKQLASPQSISALLSSYESFFSPYGPGKLFGVLSGILGWVGLARYSLHDKRGVKFLTLHTLVVALSLYSSEMWYPVYMLPTSLVGVTWLLVNSKSTLLPRLVQIIALGFAASTLSIGYELKSSSWDSYCKQLNDLVQPSDSLFLASIPDPYFCFPQRPAQMAQFIPNAIRVPRQRAEEVLDQYDVFISGATFIGEFTGEYLNRKANEFSFSQNFAGQYPITIARRKSQPSPAEK